MVTYCSKTNTSEPAFTTVINQSETRSECSAEARKNLQALKTFRTPGSVEKEVLLRSG